METITFKEGRDMLRIVRAALSDRSSNLVGDEGAKGEGNGSWSTMDGDGNEKREEDWKLKEKI